MSDETTQAVQELTHELREWRQGKPPPMDLTDESIPVLERQEEAERVGDWEMATALGAQVTQEAFSKDLTVTMTKVVDGKKVDIRDEIVRLEKWGDQGRADELKRELMAAQLYGQYEQDRQLLMQSAPAMGADEQFLPQGVERARKPQLNAEDEFPNNQLSDAIKHMGDSLGQKRVAELRQAIRQSEREKAQATGPTSSTRSRQEAAAAEGNWDDYLAAGAEEAVSNMLKANYNGLPDKPASKPAPAQESPWQVELVDKKD